MQLNALYHFKHTGFSIRYKLYDAEKYDSMDYILIHNSGKVSFYLTWVINRLVNCNATVYFKAGLAFKFKDMCNKYVVKFVVRDGDTIVMQFHEHCLIHDVFQTPVYEIVLTHVSRRA